MDRETCRRINCPYGVVLVPEKEAFAFFNRDYEPLGIPAFGGYIPDETRLAWFLGVSQLKNIDVNNVPQEVLDFSYKKCVWKVQLVEEPFTNCTSLMLHFYNDGCVPTDSKEYLAQYIDRVTRFLTFVGKREMIVCLKSIMTKQQRYNYFHRYY